MQQNITDPTRVENVRPRHLTPAQSAQVVAALRRRLDHHRGNESALARELGIGQSNVHRTITGEHGASMATAQALASVTGVAVESILASPKERAVAIAREGRLPEGAIRRVEEEPETDVRPTLYWIERILAYARLDPGP